MIPSTLSSGTKQVPYMPMTIAAIPCPAPILEDDFIGCRVPGGIELWENAGFYSPGVCFSGYRAMCTQTEGVNYGWPIRKDETVVRCIPIGYGCNDANSDQKYATSDYDGTILSAPAFEIRWRSVDLEPGTTSHRSVGSGTILPTSGDSLAPGTTPALPRSTSDIVVETTTAAIPITTTTGDFAASSSAASSPEPPPTHSAASIAGIATGGCVVLLAAIFAAGYFILQRRKKRQGLRRLEDAGWIQRNGVDGSPMHSAAQVPVELENKPMEPRELPAETQPQDAIGVHARFPHISLNSIAVEIAGESVPTTAYSR